MPFRIMLRLCNAWGLNVCINSDDAEMARRLNQEAAKSVKYGGMTEEEAFKMVTLNPAKALHVDDKVGSLKQGKDADVVIWSDNPLSIYAKAEKTIVDGIVYFRSRARSGAAQKDRCRKEPPGAKRCWAKKEAVVQWRPPPQASRLC